LKVKIKTCNTAGNVCNDDFSWHINVHYDKCLNRVKLVGDSTKIADMEASVGNSTAIIQEFDQMQSTICPGPEDCCGFRNYTIVDDELTKSFLKLETFDVGK
jgi:hypothetical protein